jgi:hypothetical protein
MVRLISAPALALTVVTAASPAAYAAHRYHYADHAGSSYRHVRLARTSRTHHRDLANRHRALPALASAVAQDPPRGPYAMSEETVERREPSRPEPVERRETYLQPRVSGGRPAAWCGWYARGLVGQDPGPAYNLARNWARWGRPANPGPGVMVVWPHHVGMITGRTADGEWIVKSGNDGHAVRERPRSLAGAIAFRES